MCLHCIKIFYLPALQYEKERLGTQDIETGVIRTPGRKWFHALVGTVFLQSFTLNFLAEWGDRSQIATIVLGAREVINQ